MAVARERTKNPFRVHDRRNHLRAALAGDETHVEVAFLDPRDFRLVLLLHLALEVRDARLAVVDRLDERFDQAAHVLQVVVVHAIRNDQRQSVEHFHAHRLLPEILDAQDADEARVVVFRDVEEIDGELQAQRAVLFLERQLRRENDHLLREIHARVGRVPLERLVEARRRARADLDEGPEALRGGQLVRAVRGQELHDRMLLVLDADAANALRAIHIEHPHRNAVRARDAWEETRERFRAVVILDDELPGPAEGVADLFRCVLHKSSRFDKVRLILIGDGLNR